MANVLRNKESWLNIILMDGTREFFEFEAKLELKLDKQQPLGFGFQSIQEKYFNWSENNELAAYKDEINLIIGLAYKLAGYSTKAIEHFQFVKLQPASRSVRNVVLSAELAFEEVQWIGKLKEGLQDDSHYREFVSDVASNCFRRACLMNLEAHTKSFKFEKHTLKHNRCKEAIDMNTGYFNDVDRRTDGQYRYGDVENLRVLGTKGLFLDPQYSQEFNPEAKKLHLTTGLKKLKLVAESRKAQFLTGVTIHLGNFIENRQLLEAIIKSAGRLMASRETCSLSADGGVIGRQGKDAVDEFVLCHTMWHMFGRPNLEQVILPEDEQ